ncbi:MULTISPECIES: AEC family transporter [unclassified Acinetobacter]|uniref:AEC family transporter n=1 Tax=unclassified Acinetobacter TaxID=196816 RepID=UPI001C246FF1|nr:MULTISPECIES: AEC family transporter [unclassified Acinetobacter]
MFQTIFTVLFPLIGLISFGYLLKRRQWLSDDFWRGAENLNYYVLFPVMLFLNLAVAKIEMEVIREVVLVVFSLMPVVSIALYVLRKVYQIGYARFGVYVQALLRFNTYIGLAAVNALFHQQGMTIFAVVMVLCIPLVNILSVLSFTRSHDMQIIKLLTDLLKNPLILGCIVGGLFNLSGLSLWTGFELYLKQIALCSLPLGLMCVGAALQFQGFQRDIWPLSLATFGRLLGMPLAAYFVCQLFNTDTLTTQVLILFFALPTASASYVLTRVYGGDSQFMANIISMQTVVAAGSLMLILSWLI